ncbi:hypothetical protein BKA80DRAFT_257103 [Phyllosticta citrichinensis]
MARVTHQGKIRRKDVMFRFATILVRIPENQPWGHPQRYSSGTVPHGKGKTSEKGLIDSLHDPLPAFIGVLVQILFLFFAIDINFERPRIEHAVLHNATIPQRWWPLEIARDLDSKK